MKDHKLAHSVNKKFTPYPKSLVQWITMGLSIVVMPLLVALGIAAIYVERATSESQQAVIFSTQAVHHSLELSDLLKDMERAARVYQVLADQNLFLNYQKLREEFMQTAGDLRSFDRKPELQITIATLLEDELDVYSTLMEQPPGSEAAEKAVEKFAAMRESARYLISENSQLIEQKVSQMQAAASNARRALMWEAVIAVGLALLVGFIVIPPLIRYMRELDRCIHELGTGNFHRKIVLSGPHDLRQLGERLEWLRQQLESLEKQKQHFLQHFSHELKTPLASIREGASLLADGVAGDLNSEQIEIARILRTNSLTLQQQVEDLLKFSISMQPFQAIDRLPVKLHEQIQAVIREHQLQSKAKELVFTTELKPLSVSGDAGRISTIIDNLVSNAVKYSPHGGKIVVNLYQEGGSAVIDVIDEGPGIQSGERQRVFDVFYKIRTKSHDHIEGSGLGLSIAQQYAKAHGGEIEVMEHNRGAFLRLFLPIRSPLS